MRLALENFLHAVGRNTHQAAAAAAAAAAAEEDEDEEEEEEEEEGGALILFSKALRPDGLPSAFHIYYTPCGTPAAEWRIVVDR